jgi:hypothetical protein
VEPVLPRLYWTLPPFPRGKGARWKDTSEGFNATHTNFTTANVQYVARDVDASGMDLDYEEVVSVPPQLLTTPMGTFQIESGKGTGRGRVRIVKSTWIERAVFDRKVVLHLRGDGPDMPANATMLITLTSEARASHSAPAPR